MHGNVRLCLQSEYFRWFKTWHPMTTNEDLITFAIVSHTMQAGDGIISVHAMSSRINIAVYFPVSNQRMGNKVLSDFDSFSLKEKQGKIKWETRNFAWWFIKFQESEIDNTLLWRNLLALTLIQTDSTCFTSASGFSIVQRIMKPHC